MTTKFGIALKRIGRKWFLFLVLAIVIIFIFNQIAALIMTIITLIAYTLSYIPIVRFNMKMKGLLSKAMFIDDKTIAKKLKQPLIKVQNKMFRLSNNQAKKSWLILYINKQYYYCNKQPIETFKKYHKEGLGEKDILEKLKNYGISMRAEIKAIEETLQKYDRLSEREISVKEYRDKQRFK